MCNIKCKIRQLKIPVLQRSHAGSSLPGAPTTVTCTETAYEALGGTENTYNTLLKPPLPRTASSCHSSAAGSEGLKGQHPEGHKPTLHIVCDAHKPTLHVVYGTAHAHLTRHLLSLEAEVVVLVNNIAQTSNS